MAAASGYQVRMAMRIMLRTGLRVSECLSLRPADLRLTQNPPILSLRPDVPGNKAKRGREVPVPADLVESLGPGLFPPQRPSPAALRHQPAVGQQEHEGGGGRRRNRPRPGPSPRPQAYLRAERGAPRGADSGAAVLAGTPVPGGDRAVCGIGGRPPFLGGTALGTGAFLPGSRSRPRPDVRTHNWGILVCSRRRLKLPTVRC